MSERNRPRDASKNRAIIDAAIEAFTVYGVKNTSMDKLAQLAKVSKRTVYNHFESKEQLVGVILMDLWARAIVQSDFDATLYPTLKEQMIALTRSEIDVLSGEQYIELCRIALGHFLYKPEDLQEVLAKVNEQESALYKLLTSAMAAGQIKQGDVQFAYDQLHMLIKGRCFWPQIVGIEPLLSDAQKSEVAEYTVEMFLGYFATTA